MTELEQFHAREAIKQVVIEFAHALDTRDWARLASLLTADACGEQGGAVSEQEGRPARDGAGEIVLGRDAFVACYRRLLENCGATQHLLGNFRIDIHAERAFCRCYVRAMHVGKGYLRTTLYDLWGLYEDELVATEGGWKICRRVERAFHEIGDRSLYALDDEMI